MFGLTEITALLDEPTKLAIIPTFVLPFTVLGMILTSVATWVAALFGIKLHTEGPRRLFEVLIKPKVLLLALLSNILFYGLYWGGNYIKNHSYPLWWVQYQNPGVASSRAYADFNLLQQKAALKDQTATPISFEQVWEQDLKDIIFGNLVISGGSVFVGGSKGRVTEIDVNKGEVLRHFEIGQAVTAAPLILHNKLYVGEGLHLTHHARMYSFDLSSGKFIGAYQTLGHIERSANPVQVKGRNLILFPAGRDGIYAVDAESLQKVWQAPIGHVDATPITDGDYVYVGTGEEEGDEHAEMKAVALRLDNGQVVWERALPTSAWGIPVLWQDDVCFAVGDVYKRTQYGQIACYDRKTGSSQFAINTPGALLAQSQVIGDKLLISDFNGVIYQFDLKQKKLDWSIPVPTHGFNYSSVVVDDQDRLIAPGERGIYVYSRATQKLLTLWEPPAENSTGKDGDKDKRKNNWISPYVNVALHKSLWIVTDGAGKLRALRPLAEKTAN